MATPGLGYEILGAVKVKDGLFVGDELAAQDLEFVVSNKVTRIINCCGRQVPNHWESVGVVYLTYYWVDADSQVILDPRDATSNETFGFIEEALMNAESVLIHSVRGQSRSCCILAAYMMSKYGWSLRNAMEFLSFRRPDMALKVAFLQQLTSFERRLSSTRTLSNDWNSVDFSRLECEELLLRNTYLNSRMGPLAEYCVDGAVTAVTRRLVWQDNDQGGDKQRLEKAHGADRHNLGGLRCILKKKGKSSSVANGGQKELGDAVPSASFFRNAASGPAGGSGQADRVANWHSESLELQAQLPFHPQQSHGYVNNYIRDSLTLGGQNQGNEQMVLMPQRTAASRDPSPKASPSNVADSRRGGDSPQFVESEAMARGRSSRGASPCNAEPRRFGANAAGNLIGPAQSFGPMTANLQPGSFGLNVGNMMRAPMSSSSLVAGGPPRGGMGAFRTGGPVRAKVDLLSGSEGGAPDRRSTIRPAYTPLLASGGPQLPPGMRPASRTSSPIALQRGSGSRPNSPQGSIRSSTTRSFMPGHAYPSMSSNGRPLLPQAPQMQQFVQQQEQQQHLQQQEQQQQQQKAHAQMQHQHQMNQMQQMQQMQEIMQQRSLSSHLRRAPSPTPAFNTSVRSSSPSKPRWRS